MTSLETSLAFSKRGWRVFPCIPRGPRRKQPLTPNGFRDASTDLAIIARWWRRWPNALIGLATGAASGFVVLDVDVKYADSYGFDTLDALGFAMLPETPMAHTASGGLHLYFAPPLDPEIGCTEGDKGRGIGRGLDWRGRGGYIIAPSPGSGYEWDAHKNLDTVRLATVPPALLPRAPERTVPARPIEPADGLSPYARAALNDACRHIVAASEGQQEATLNGEAFAIGTLAGAGAVPPDFALSVLLYAAGQIQDYDLRRPWRPAEIQCRVNRAFDAGMRHPRKIRRA
jgi:putative DNA primase/helicase